MSADEPWTRAEVESPCTKVCVIHPDARICIGCRRTLDEIAGWSRMTGDERRAVVAALPGRAGQLAGARRGGRSGRLARRRQD